MHFYNFVVLSESYIHIKIRICQPFKTLYSPYSKQLLTWYSSRLLGLQNLFSLPHLHPPQLFPELIVFSTWTFSVIVYNFCSTLNIDTYPVGHFGKHLPKCPTFSVWSSILGIFYWLFIPADYRMCIYIDFLFFFTFLEVLEILRICPLLHVLTKFSHLCSGIYLINFR